MFKDSKYCHVLLKGTLPRIKRRESREAAVRLPLLALWRSLGRPRCGFHISVPAYSPRKTPQSQYVYAKPRPSPRRRLRSPRPLRLPRPPSGSPPENVQTRSEPTTLDNHIDNPRTHDRRSRQEYDRGSAYTKRSAPLGERFSLWSADPIGYRRESVRLNVEAALRPLGYRSEPRTAPALTAAARPAAPASAPPPRRTRAASPPARPRAPAR